ncbi:MAG: hypothetical protein WCG45_05140 [bacterium]
MKEIKNLEIREACQTVLNICNNYAKQHKSMPLAKKMLEETKENSLFNNLVENFMWAELFENKSWLLLLTATQNLIFTKSGNTIIEKINLILEYFPEQTKGYISKL